MLKPMVEKSPNSADGLDARLQILDFGDGEGGVFDADAGGALANVDQAVFVAIDERAEEHAADHAEDGGVGADAQRESENHGDRQTLGVRQGAQRNFQIAEKQVELGHRRSTSWLFRIQRSVLGRLLYHNECGILHHGRTSPDAREARGTSVP